MPGVWLLGYRVCTATWQSNPGARPSFAQLLVMLMVSLGCRVKGLHSNDGALDPEYQPLSIETPEHQPLSVMTTEHQSMSLKSGTDTEESSL